MVDPKGDKVARVYAVQPLFESGVVQAPDRSWAELTISECAIFPKGKHDDLVDATRIALGWLRKRGLLMPPAEAATENARELAIAATKPVFRKPIWERYNP
jgi:hypothetical protein